MEDVYYRVLRRLAAPGDCRGWHDTHRIFIAALLARGDISHGQARVLRQIVSGKLVTRYVLGVVHIHPRAR